MTDVNTYALRVWHEDLDKIEDFLNEHGHHDTNEIIAHFKSVPDGSEVMGVVTDDAGDLLSCGAIVLETFNQNYEWRDRDDTIGLFTRAHKK